MVKFGGLQSYGWMFDCAGVGSAVSTIVSGTCYIDLVRTTAKDGYPGLAMHRQHGDRSNSIYC